jgi:hypothetical protein
MMTSNVDSDTDRRPAISGVTFETRYSEDPDKPGHMRGVDWVSWVKAGDAMKSRTSESISRLMPNPAKRRPADPLWPVIEAAYKAWKAGNEIPLDGTPLAAWPGCDPNLAEALKSRGVLTVEHFAEMADHQVGSIQMPDVRRRQTTAKAFLDAQKGVAHVAAQLAERDDRPPRAHDGRTHRSPRHATVGRRARPQGRVKDNACPS